ncbi:uncharacterized protein LOC108466061 [Gossypium arboreum]|uniref:uncharacterized protein LOC108466061 n=1 Tax=Gossypium arboreum TaxID=29729 RepID=UPI00081969B5|nr:uncharacterized protein LOC108466061 [Gossypium arboreum]
MGKHLRLHGIIKEYKQWIFHGESIERTSVQTDQTVRTSPSISTCDNEADLRDLITDALGINIPTLNESFDGFSSEFQNNGREYDVNKAQKTAKRETTLLDDCDIPLYPGCVKFSCVSFLLRVYHFKALYGWSAKSLTCLLEFLNEAFPDGNTIPTTYYEAKKKISALNLGYLKIDACLNDCMLYWGDASKKISCDVCKSSRWQSSNELDVDEQVDDLKRLFQSSKTSQFMRWHKEGRTKYGILRHPSDGFAWDAFDKRFPDFASDPRNVRLGWSTKGRVACPSHEFDSTIESGVAPTPRSEEDILREVEGVNFIYGKGRKRDREELDEGSAELDVDEGCDLFNNFEELVDEVNLINQDETLWKKRSIFFDLPYWRYNLLRHNLDVMHIEKNVCDNVIGTLLNLSLSGKDNIKARKDLQDIGI